MQLQVGKDQKEIKKHGSHAFPVMISHENLQSYERGSFFWHWHPEIELTLILEGSIEYQVNQNTYTLCAGQGLFCNTNMLHTGHMLENKNCLYLSITFDPKIIYGFDTSIIYQNYVRPILKSSLLDSFSFDMHIDWQKEILEDMAHIMACDQSSTLTSSDFDNSLPKELYIQNKLSHIWMLLFAHTTKWHKNGQIDSTELRDQKRLKTILSFIHAHYQEKITLEDIADQIHLCKSECCRFFKKHMKMSLFDYLMHYRIEQSLPLLQNTDLSITDIALQSGFQNSSYYTKIFKKFMQVTPKQYR